MKFFAFIMAIIVLVLSVKPCADKGNPIKDSKAKTELTQSSKQKGYPYHDACSPFCICSCCAGFSINHAVPKMQSFLSVNKINYSQSYYCAVTTISLPIWQPPQL